MKMFPAASVIKEVRTETIVRAPRGGVAATEDVKTSAAGGNVQ